MHEVAYLHLKPEGDPPIWIGRRPFNAVIVATTAVSDAWQDRVSDWVVRSGCLYMMAWGVNCSTWDDTVDRATRNYHQPGEIPDEGFVMTTWHADETMESVFWYAQFNGVIGYNDQILDQTLIIDIGNESRRVELLGLFERSRDLADREG